MIDNAPFDDRSPRLGLPFLFPGQAQREFYVNESLARLDVLVHPVIESEVSSTPPTPVAGQTFLISDATGDWENRNGQLAFWDGQIWTFLSPFEGLRIFDKSAGRYLLFKATWEKGTVLTEPAGGTTVDIQARAAIAEIVGIMRQFGLAD